MAEKINLFELEINADAAIKELAISQQEVKKLKEELKSLSKAEGDNSVAIAEKTVALKNAQKSVRENTKVVQASEVAEKSNTESLKKVQAQSTLLRKEREKLNFETEEGRQRLEEINEQLDKNNQYIAENSDKHKQNKLNVGNYTESINKANIGSKIFGNSLKGLASNPFTLVLVVLVAALKGLFDAFTKTQRGSDMLNKGMASLGAIFEYFQGILVDVADYLIEAFENPQDAISDLGNFLKDNLINRLEGLLLLLPRLGKAIKQVFSGDFAEAGRTATDALMQVTTGVEDFSDKATDVFEEVSKDILKAAKTAEILLNAQVALERQLSKTMISLAKLNKEAEIQQQIADNSTESFAERQKASELARKSSEEAAKIELNLAKQQLRIVQLQIRQKQEAGFMTRQLKQQEAEAIAEVINKEKDLTLTINENAKVREEIDRDLFEKNLDYLLDNYDNVKSINERIINNTKKSYDERLKLLNVTRQLGQKSFNEQIKEIQSRTKIEINANSLLTESNSRALIEKVRLLKLDEIEETRLLEVIKDRRTAVQDLAETEVTLTEEKNQKLKEFNDNARLQELESESQNSLIVFERQRINLEKKRLLEIEYAEKIGADTTIIEEKYAKIRKTINEAEQRSKLQLATNTFGEISTILGEHTEIGKAAAIAQTTINTYLSATAAYAALAGIPVVGPILGGIAAGAAIISGLANAQKIASTKVPKAEKGALFQVNGKRHSEGGTQFYGEDGTRFEAEKGEVIGVMNRNAARLFMDFNNKYRDGGIVKKQNYFASGGMVSNQIREQVNYDLLAEKIASANKQLPRPIVSVVDINSRQDSYTEVVEGANLR